MSFLKKLFEPDLVKGLHPLVEKINALESEFEKKTQEGLRALTRAWKEELKELGSGSDTASDKPINGHATGAKGGEREEGREGSTVVKKRLEEILPETFAAVREASKRTLGQRHFDVQLIGGMTLHKARIAEMKTGEGKTLAATLPIYLNALAGRGVHLVTVNDYLARRDASWMGQIYDYLGMSVGTIQHAASFRYESEHHPVLPPSSSAKATADKRQGGEGLSEVELDVKNLVPCSRREAYGSDVTYGTNNEFGFDYLRDNMVQTLNQKAQRGHYFAIVDEVDSILIDEARTPLIISAPDQESTDKYFEFAKHVEKLKENEDYNVDEKKKSATLTEEGIARLEKMLGIENIYVEKGISTVHHLEQALRSRTLFRRDRDYVVREGQIVIVDEFTGRLLPGRRFSEGLHQAIEAKEGVTVQRESKTLASITFQNYFRQYKKLAGMTGTAKTEEEEFIKIYGLEVAEIPTNMPVVRRDLSDAVFKNEKGKHEALVKEVRQRYEAGQPILIGTVSIERNETISGVLKQAGIPHEILNAKNHEQEAKIIAQAGRFKAVTLATNIAGRGVDIILGGAPYNKEEAEKVIAVGGLHILGTERHESRRIDNQLRGRSGRQGDPGSSQFYVSLEDDLIRLFGGDRVQKMMTTLGVPDDMPIENKMVSRVIESAQKKIEGLNFDTRKHVLEYDDVMNKQREVIYKIRDRSLQPQAELKEEFLQKIDAEIASVVNFHTTANDKSEWNFKEIGETMATILPFFAREGVGRGSRDEIIEKLTGLAHEIYEEKEKKIGAQVMRQIEKALLLRGIDVLWMQQLDTMDHLRASVSLRGYAQKDPLVEYKKEGFKQFKSLLADIDKNIVYSIFKVELRTAPQHQHQHSGFVTNTSAPQGERAKKIGRNEIVTVTNPETGESKQIKFKKAERLLEQGWKLV